VPRACRRWEIRARCLAAIYLQPARRNGVLRNFPTIAPVDAPVEPTTWPSGKGDWNKPFDPSPSQPDGQTHWDDCWREGPRHYHCACAKLEAAEAKLKAREGYVMVPRDILDDINRDAWSDEKPRMRTIARTTDRLLSTRRTRSRTVDNIYHDTMLRIEMRRKQERKGAMKARSTSPPSNPPTPRSRNGWRRRRRMWRGISFFGTKKIYLSPILIKSGLVVYSRKPLMLLSTPPSHQ